LRDLLTVTPDGLFCPQGDFFVDPWKPVHRAVFTHPHADHARPGHTEAFAATDSLPVLRHRLGPEAPLHGLAYQEELALGDARISLHPAGHILGSAQIRIEVAGEVWVVTGDFKRAADPTCAPFVTLPADVLVTEATFGLPVYVWEEPVQVVEAVFQWWELNRRLGRPSLLFCYALGKAQRLLAELMRWTDRPVYVHGAVEAMTAVYREQGVSLLPTLPVADTERGHKFDGELVLAPVSARGTPWLRRFVGAATGFASGWMRLRGTRRRKGYERGFVLSDHADWPDLLRTVEESGARRVLVTHGYTHPLARYLREVKGLQAEALETPFEGEAED
jgi:putative mRNA 3-end processing factor